VVGLCLGGKRRLRECGRGECGGGHCCLKNRTQKNKRKDAVKCGNGLSLLVFFFVSSGRREQKKTKKEEEDGEDVDVDLEKNEG
jgi:hypothetical protein